MRVITKVEVTEHRSADSCWVVRSGRVYDVTKFLANHPGGRQNILDYAGDDITLLMNAADPHRHSKNAYRTLSQMCIGVLEGYEDKLAQAEAEFAEPVDWDKPMLAQVGKLGKQYNTWVHNPVDRWVRLFSSDFMEIFSKCPWYVVPIVWLPVLCHHLHVTWQNLASEPTVTLAGMFDVTLRQWHMPLFFIFGLLLWPLIEYILHRFVFHLEPTSGSPFWIRFHFTIHGQHHKAPFDPYHLVFPPFPAACLYVAFYATYSLLFPACVLHSVLAGSILGYVCYDLTHYYLHHGHPSPNSYLGRLKKHHIKHHYVDFNKGYGVSNKLIDHPFGTAFPPENKPRSD